MKNINIVMSALKPMLYVTKFLGFTPFILSTNSSNELSLLCVFWGALLIILNTISSYYSLFFKDSPDFHSLVEKIIDYLASLFHYLNFNCVVLCSLIFYKNILEVIENLGEVHNRILETNLLLRANKADIKESLNTNIVTFFFVFYAIGLSIFAAFLGYYEGTTAYVRHIIWLIFAKAPVVAQLQFYALIYIMKQHLLWLNKILRTATANNLKWQRNVIFALHSYSTYEHHKNIILVRRVGELHLKLWSISKNINKAYSFQTLMISLQAFLFILNMLVFILISIINNKYEIPLQLYLLFVNFIFFFLLPIVVITILCSNTLEKAEETKQLFLQLKLPSQNNDHDFEILCTSLQMLHNKIEFSALGLFTVDKRFLYLFLTTIASYTVIILQFDLTLH